MSQSEILRFLLQGDAKGLTSALQEANSRLNGTEDAAERAALAIEMLTAAAETKMRSAAVATEALSTALGQETVAAIERAGGSIDGWVADLNRAGVAYDEIAAKADRFAGVIRNAEGVAGNLDRVNDASGRASDGVERLGRSSDQSRSVLANMVGNSIQDMGALGGVAGSAGVMIGQIGEYAADGNIQLSNLVKLAGPMVGLGLATAGVTAFMNAQRREAEELARITQFLGGLQEQIAANDFKGAGSAIANEYSDTVLQLERYGYSVKDLLMALDDERMLVRQLTSDISDLESAKQSMIDNPYNYSADDLAAVDAEIAKIKEVIKTVTEDAAANRVAAEQRERNTRVAAEATSVLDRWNDGVREGSRSMDQNRTSADRLEGQIGSLQARLDQYVEALGGVPDEMTTEVQAAIDAGDLARAGQLLDQLTRPRVVPLYIVPQLMDGKPAGTSARGSAAAGTGSKGPSTAYNPAAILSGILSPAKSGGGGGGGGGGGAADEPDEPTPEEIARAWENAVGNLFDTGQFSLAAYRDFLQGRLGLYQTYSDDYKRIWSGLRELDRIEQDEKDKAAEAERRRAEAAEKAAEEAARARELQLDALRQLVEILNGFVSMQYGNLEGAGNVTGGGAAGMMTAGQLGGVLSDLLGHYVDGVS